MNFQQKFLWESSDNWGLFFETNYTIFYKFDIIHYTYTYIQFVILAISTIKIIKTPSVKYFKSLKTSLKEFPFFVFM